MPRAVDPGIFTGGGLPITHSPLNRISFQNREALPFSIDDLIDGAIRFLEDFILPALEQLTGIDLSIFLPLLDLINLDFSSPAAFLMSLIDSILMVPAVLFQLINGFIDELMNLPETFAMFIGGIVELLVQLPSLIIDLLTGLIIELANLTGVDLSIFLPLLDLLNIDFTSPAAFLSSLMTAIMSIPAILSDILAGVLQELTDLTGIDLSIFLPLLDILNFDFSSPATFLSSIVTSIMSIPEVFIDLINGFVTTIGDLPDTMTDLLDKLVEQLGLLPEILQSLLTQLVFVLTDLTGVDLTIFLPLLDLLNFDFSSPEAFIASITTSIMSLPDVFMDFINGFITLLGTDPTAMGDMLTGLIETLLSIPTMLTDLLSGLINLLVSTPDILLSLTEALIELLVSAPDILMSLLSSLIDMLVNAPAIVVQLGQALLDSVLGFLGASSPLNSLNLFNIIPTDILAHISGSNVGTGVVNMITDPLFMAFGGMGEWFQDLLGGFEDGASASVMADGTTHELMGNMIPVSEGQVLPISGKARWTGLTGSGTPVQLGLVGYVPGGSTVEATVASRSTSPSTTNWVEMGGSYTVPANVSSIRTRLRVGSGATGGQVWFSDLKASKSQPLLQRIIGGTDIDTFLPDDIENLFNGIISNTLEIINKTPLADYLNLVDIIGGPIGNTVSAVDARLNAMLHGGSTLNGSKIGAGTIADQFIPGLGGIKDLIVTSILGVGGSGFNDDQVTNALTAVQRSVTEVSTRVDQLFSSVATGDFIRDTFERASNSSLGANWLTSYLGAGAGVIATPKGHSASWIPNGTAPREFLSILNSGIVRSSDDFQRISKVISTAIGLNAFNDIWLRLTDSTTSLSNASGIRVRYGGNGSVLIDRFLSGAKTTLASLGAGSITPPGVGSIVSGQAGIGGNPRAFSAMIGTSTILQIVETGVASILGTNARRWGMGGAAGAGGAGGGQSPPGDVFQWQGMTLTAEPGASGAGGGGG